MNMNYVDTMTMSEAVRSPKEEEQTMVRAEHDPIITTSHETPKVDRMLAAFASQWEVTAKSCIDRAKELEDAAAGLRARADALLNARVHLDDVKDTVIYEIDSRDAHARLMFVNPSKDD